MVDGWNKMPNGKLTLDDIARIAGVSRATASRIISGEVGARSKSRERVLRIVEETGYQPHAAARSLASQRTFIIGLIVPTPTSAVLSEAYWMGLIDVISQACNSSDYTLALFTIGSEEVEKKLSSRISARGLLDGVIYLDNCGLGGAITANNLISKMLSVGLPFVVSGKDIGNFPNVSFVDFDQEGAATTAVTHLLHLGRKRVATVTGLLSSTHGAARLEGYRKAIRSYGMRVDKNLISNGDFTGESGYYAAQRLLDAMPDAIFAASDQMAEGVLRALHEAGLRVPDDVAVVGFDDFPYALETDPPLTTVRTSLKLLGTTLVDVLIDIINNGDMPSQHIILGTELVIRGSCGMKCIGTLEEHE